jgi:sugar lactone lactonase YvrE
MRRRLDSSLKRVAVSTALLLAGSAAQLGAQPSPQLTALATGLNCPRGLAFSPNGTLYVAEAGLGAGDADVGFRVGVGFTGSLTEIRGLRSGRPVASRLVTGLASSATVSPDGSVEPVGPDGVSVQGNGGIYVIMAESTSGVLEEDPGLDPAAARQFGRLLKVTASGQWKVTADVGDFDWNWTSANQNAPWAPAGQFPDANPYGVLALPGRQYVVDAGANTLNEVRPDGSIRIIAYVPDPLLPLPNGQLVPVSDSVPTCVAQGPDGSLYVGTLAFGANFARLAPDSPWHSLPPQSKVYRINPNQSGQFLSEADVWARGFNPITGCAFGPDGLYVVEFMTQASHYSSGQVVRVAMNPDGSAGARTYLGAGALHQPNGIALSADGSVYVSNNSVSAGIGEVVRVNY